MANATGSKELKAVETGLKKISVTKVNLAKQPTGYSFKGKYLGQIQGDPFKRVNTATGEIVEKVMTFTLFETESGDRVTFPADKGLLSALKDSMVKEGQVIMFVKLEKTALSGERTMNQYDIYA